MNPGEIVEIEIFLTGHGEIPNLRKLGIAHSSPYLYEEDNEGKIGVLEWCIKVALDERNGEVVGVFLGDYEGDVRERGVGKHIRAREEYRIAPSGVMVELNPGYFLSNREATRLSGGTVDEHDYRLLSEMMHDNHPPMLLRVNTSKNSRPGDHDIYLTLIYGDDDSELKMDQKAVRFHVNSWVERHSKALQWIIVLLGLLALSAEVIQTIFAILSYLTINALWF